MASETLKGSCHCGAVSYLVEVDPASAITCNCSICTRLGAVWAFAPRAKFRLTSGGDRRGDYQFNTRVAHHRFCITCGIESYAEGKAEDGSDRVGINLRCVEGVDIGRLTPKTVDGRSH
jgi:hypothetical protein